jgi:D-alanine-D-alanine ligase
MRLAFTYNVRHLDLDPNNPASLAEAEFDTPETIDTITEALESLGHTVYKVEADENVYENLKRLRGTIDLVFNFAEGLHGNDREAQIPAMLEMLQIPYTGPRPLAYALGLHKAKAKEVMHYYGIPTARWNTATSMRELREKNVDFFPAIVKPVGEGSSKGIYAKNLVTSTIALEAVAEELLRTYPEVMVEEFLPGREFTVGVLGTPPQILPIIEVIFDDLPEGMPKFDHYEAKWVYDTRELNINPMVCPANIDADLAEKIKAVALQAFDVLEMADWARLDIRLDKNGIPNVIEINCPPGMLPDPRDNSRFPRAARVAGIDFAGILEKILRSACTRYDIRYHVEVPARAMATTR